MQNTYALSRKHPLTEVEVYTGSVLGNEDGSLPTRRMRETAKSMRDVFEDGVADIVHRIEGRYLDEEDEDTPQDDPLERSIACFFVSLEDDWTKAAVDRLVSFRYVSAMVVLRQIEIFRRVHEVPEVFSLSLQN